jgi:hypothetical protein
VFGPGGDVGETLVTEFHDGDVEEEAEPDGKARLDRDAEQPSVEGTVAPSPPMEPTSRGAAADYGASEDESFESVMVHGDVILGRVWTGSAGLLAGSHLRGDERGVQVGAWGGVYRRITPSWRVGVTGKLQTAPAIAGGTDAAAYLTLRGFLGVGGVPLVGLDAGLGASLDVPGLAWRAGLRLGGWRFAPVVSVDQVYAAPAEEETPRTRTTLGLGIEASF